MAPPFRASSLPAKVTGGFHGAAYMTGSALGKAVVFGRIAGARQAAAAA
jgi:fumarate reductase flavoprotein subunit